MTLSININPGQAVSGGVALGVMTSAGNPWSVPDELAHSLVQRGVATAVNWPAPVQTSLTAAQVAALLNSAQTGPGTSTSLTPGNAAYPGIEVDPLTSTSGWTVTTNSGVGGTVTASTMSDGSPCLAFTVNPGVGTVFMTKSVVIPYDQDTVVGLWLECPDNGRLAACSVLVSNETGGTFTNWKTIGVGGSGGATFRNTPYFINVAVPDFGAGGGTFATNGSILSVRVRADNPYKNQGGTIKVRSLCISKRARPKIGIAFDDGFQTQYTDAFRYMSGKYGLTGTIAVNSSLIGTANYMTLAQCQAMYAAGWHMCGHTPSHTAFNSKSLNSIATAQTPAGAGNMTLDGSVGTGTFDAPRHVVVRAASDQGVKLTITGLDASGAALTEDLYTWTGSYPVPSQNLFSKVTTIAVDQAAAGTITVGTSLSRQEMSDAITGTRDWLIANGMPAGANDFVYPQGEFNTTSDALAASLGMRSMRIVSGQLQSPQAGDFRKYQLPGFGGGGAALDATALNALRTRAIREGRNTIIYLHELIQTGSPTATQTLTAQFQSFIDSCVADAVAGKCTLTNQAGLPIS